MTGIESAVERSVLFVVPAYNEAASIADLIALIDDAARDCGWRHRILVVDDGSHDGTGDAAAAASEACVVLRHAANQGLGRALRSGLRRAVAEAESEDIVITLDADLTHDPRDAAALIAAVDGGADVAIASRAVPGSRVDGVTVARRALSHGASLAARWLAPVDGVGDYSSGYRAYSCAILRDAFDRRGDDLISESGFGCQLELLQELAGYARFAEVPFVLHYGEKRRTSAIRVLPTAVAYVRVITAARRRRVQGHGHTR